MTTDSSSIDTITLQVAGMTCGSCEWRIRQELDRVPGYVDAQVSIAEGRVNVSYAASETAPADLIDAVGRAGYAAVLAESGAAPAEDGAAPDSAAADGGASCACCAPKSL